MSEKIPQSLEHLKHIGAKRKTAQYHSLTKEQRIAMRNSGFLLMEIKEFDEVMATKKLYGTKHFSTMMRSRSKWRAAMKLAGWNDKEIDSRIRRFISRRKGGSPWDFFRAEYDRLVQAPTLTRGKFDSYYKLRREMSSYLGRAYGRVQSAKRSHYLGLPGIPKKRK